VSNTESTYEQQLAELLESGGAPSPELAAALQSDAALAGEYAALRHTDGVLRAMAAARVVPSLDVDLWPGIQELLDAADPALEAAIEALAPKDAAAPPGFLDNIMASLPAEDETGIDPALEGALISLGASYRAQVPAIDIVDAVLNQVKRGGDSAGNIVTFPQSSGMRRPVQERPLWYRTAAAAAVAALVFGAGFYLRELLPASPRQMDLARNGGPNGASPATLAQTAEGEALHLAQATGPDGEMLDGDVTPPGPRSQPLGGRARPQTLKELVDTHLNAMRDDADALGQMGQWASLTPEEASALLEKAGLSSDALLGAAQFLPPEQAIPLLEAAIAANPDDAYLRYALADQYRGTDQDAAYLDSLRAWQTADPGNSLPYFLEAEMLLAQGDTAGGTALLNQAATASSAESYDSRRAIQHAAALEAAGYSSPDARYIAAVTAGSDEYAMLRGLGDGLMEQGRLLEEQGFADSAADVYDSLRVMGEQAELSARTPNTLTAALEIQESAIGALYALQDLWQPETLDALEVMATEVVNGLQDVADLMGAITDSLGSDPAGALDFTNQVLSGDLSGLFDLFIR